MKKELLPIGDQEKFLRAFAKSVRPATPLSRLGFSSGFFGKFSAEKIVLYRAKGGILSLFALTLYGKFELRKSPSGKAEPCLIVSFSRSRPIAVLWCLWCLLVAAAGLSLLSDSLFLGGFNLIVALLSALPLFLFSKKEKQTLLSFEKESRKRKL